jgi:hypothetical protein
MNMLDRLYTKFDLLSEKYDVFKVETIGDSYMAVTNLHKDQSAGKRLVFRNKCNLKTRFSPDLRIKHEAKN